MRIITIGFFFFIIAGGCKTYSYFTSSNNLLNKDCQVFLIDGKEIDGKLTIQFETGHDVDRYVKIQIGSNAEKKIFILDIQYYKYEGEYYFPKEIDLEAYEIPNRDKIYTPNVSNLLFMKRLTKEGAKIQLFQLDKSQKNSPDATDQYEYYVSLNDENRFMTWNIRSSKFFPNFQEKMSKIVFDCPSLSEKITQKMNGYIVKQISVDAKKYEVIRKIVDEYNNCK